MVIFSIVCSYYFILVRLILLLLCLCFLRASGNVGFSGLTSGTLTSGNRAFQGAAGDGSPQVEVGAESPRPSMVGPPSAVRPLSVAVVRQQWCEREERAGVQNGSGDCGTGRLSAAIPYGRRPLAVVTIE